MATFVLVPGAWCGGWCWKRVAPRLRAAGHEVYTPTLTGLGERVHLLSREIGVQTHVQDLLGVLTYEDLSAVTVVAHTYGAMIATAAAEHAAHRMAHLVFVDGLVPADGQSLLECLGPRATAFWLEQARTGGDGWKLPPHAAEDMDIPDEADRRWLDATLTPHPLRTYQEPIRLANVEAAALPRMHISCTLEQGPVMGAAAARAREAGWGYRELASGSHAMITAPRELAAMLLDLV